MTEIPRLSRKEMVILQLLADNSPEYGLGLVRASKGALKRGTIYVTLNRMEEKGYVRSYKEEEPDHRLGPPRRMYSPTEHGLRVLRAFEQLASSVLSPAGYHPRLLNLHTAGADR